MTQLLVSRRFCGPPTSANGGYICGLVADAIGEAVTVRLLAPPPLDTPMRLHAESEGRWSLMHGEQRVIEARRETLEIDVPPAVAFADAQHAAFHQPAPADHPAPTCFVCGTARAHGDGLRLFAVPANGRDDVVATSWLPAAEFARADGCIAPPFIAAALDCPGFHALRSGIKPYLLGEYHCRIDRPVRAQQSSVIVGWKLEDRGRRQVVGTALFDESGQLCAVARGTWIEPRPPAPPPGT